MLSSVEGGENPLISNAGMYLRLELHYISSQQLKLSYNALSPILLSSMKKKVKLEFFDRSGVKHSVAIEGDFTVEKVSRLLDYAEVVAGSAPRTSLPAGTQDNKMHRLLDVINTQLTGRSFDSREVWRSYRETWGDDFSLGAVSTYLARLVDRGTLERTGSSAHWLYRLRPSQPSQPLSQ